MIRLAILGNSHIAALRLAWRTLASRHPDVQITFFGGVTPVLSAMTLDARHHFGLHDPGLVSEGDRAKTQQLFGALSVDLTGIDSLALCGLPWGIEEMLALTDAFDIDGLIETGAPRHLSIRAFEGIARDVALRGLPESVWQHWPGRKILMPRPMPPERVQDGDSAWSEQWRRVTPRGMAVVMQRYRDLHAAVAEGRGYDLCHQPGTTLTTAGLTEDRFNEAPPKFGNLQAQRRADDRVHMNAEFGARWLDSLIARLAPAAARTNRFIETTGG